MRRHAWNCDLSTKLGTDILTNRHIYIYRCWCCLYPTLMHQRGWGWWRFWWVKAMDVFENLHIRSIRLVWLLINFVWFYVSIFFSKYDPFIHHLLQRPPRHQHDAHPPPHTHLEDDVVGPPKPQIVLCVHLSIDVRTINLITSMNSI